MLPLPERPILKNNYGSAGLRVAEILEKLGDEKSLKTAEEMRLCIDADLVENEDRPFWEWKHWK